MSIHTENAAKRAILARLQKSATISKIELMHHTKPVDTNGTQIPGKWSLYSNTIETALVWMEDHNLIQYRPNGELPGRAFGDYTITPKGRGITLDSLPVDETQLPPYKSRKKTKTNRITIADPQTAVTQILGAANPKVASITALLEPKSERQL